MVKTSGGRQKSDLIADFHRDLRQTPEPSGQHALRGSAASTSTSKLPTLTGTYG